MVCSTFLPRHNGQILVLGSECLPGKFLHFLAINDEKNKVQKKWFTVRGAGGSKAIWAIPIWKKNTFKKKEKGVMIII